MCIILRKIRITLKLEFNTVLASNQKLKNKFLTPASKTYHTDNGGDHWDEGMRQ